MSLQLAAGPKSRVRPERRARVLSGLPRPVDRSRSWLKRTVRNPWAWSLLLLLLTYPLALWQMYSSVHPDQHIQGHVIPGLNNDALKEALGLAARTAAVWVLVFLIVDRFRRQAVWMYIVTFGWGACIATWSSMYLNTWFGDLMMVRGAGDPAAGVRPAIFSAPFVEEGTKATILFLLAVLVLNRISSILQAVTLAGLTATGFAFTENIVYYARARVYASYQAGAGDADAAVQQLFMLRGVYTSFGHMLFTSLTGIGIGVAVRTRSKLVRILAPLTGFVLAALCHMSFNGISSLVSESQLTQYWFIALGLVAAVMMFLIGCFVRDKRRIKNRLNDFVTMGWLNPRDPEVFSSVRRRQWLLIVAARRGPQVWRATHRLMADITELAYTRDAEVRGVVDDAAHDREKQLILEIAALRPMALTETVGLRLQLPWRKLMFWRALRRFQRPQVAAPAGSAWPAPSWSTRR